VKIKDLTCLKCEKDFLDVYLENHEDGPGKYPHCPECGGEREWLPSPVANFEHGSKYFASIDRWMSKSEIRQYLKRNDLGYAPSADKHHGARNESHLNLGKKFSYTGQPNRS
jgi:hypothetical protein